MNDRFKFRGMNKGKWYYGGYFKHLPYTPQPIRHSEVPEKDYKHLIIQDSFSDWGLPRNMTCIEVEPETVGQCTGIADKNGKLIYEGDVLKNLLNGKKYKVAWVGCQASFELHQIISPNDEDYKKAQPIAIYFANGGFQRFQVLGNIYENSELLEVENV